MVAKAKKSKETMGERIRAARIARDLYQEELGVMIGVRRESVSQWEKDITKPLGDNLVKLAEALQVSGTYLIKGGEAGIKTVVYVPEFMSMDKGVKRATAARVGNKAFWWRVPDRDTSMVCPNGDVSFPPGTILVVDPDAKLESGDYVLAQVKGSKSLICRQYQESGNRKLLLALNAKYGTSPFVPAEFQGVVIELQRSLKG